MLRDDLPMFLTTAEAAEIIRMKPEYVTAVCRAGTLRAAKLGNEWRIHQADLEEFMRGEWRHRADDYRFTARQRRMRARGTR